MEFTWETYPIKLHSFILHIDFRMQSHSQYLLVVVVVSSVAVIFAITWVVNNHNVRIKLHFLNWTV